MRMAGKPFYRKLPRGRKWRFRILRLQPASPQLLAANAANQMDQTSPKLCDEGEQNGTQMCDLPCDVTLNREEPYDAQVLRSIGKCGNDLTGSRQPLCGDLGRPSHARPIAAVFVRRT